jgi:hypothetical protein
VVPDDHLVARDREGAGSILGARRACAPLFAAAARRVPTDKLDERTAAAIAEVSQGSTGTLRVKMHDKLAALVTLGKHLGMFVQRTQNTNVHYVISDQPLPVKETFGDETVWEGIVHVFKINGHPRARMAYAWSSPIEGGDKRQFFAVLHQRPVTSPVEAVAIAHGLPIPPGVVLWQILSLAGFPNQFFCDS